MTHKPNPIDISDEDIEKMYRELWGFSQGNYQAKMAADLLTAEMNRRLVADTSAENQRLSEKTYRESSNWAKLSLGISVLALSIACLSAWFSYLDYKGDTSWQSKQIEKIQNLEARLIENNKDNHLSLKDLGQELTAAIKSIEITLPLQKPMATKASKSVGTHKVNSAETKRLSADK